MGLLGGKLLSIGGEGANFWGENADFYGPMCFGGEPQKAIGGGRDNISGLIGGKNIRAPTKKGPGGWKAHNGAPEGKGATHKFWGGKVHGHI